MVQSNSLSLRNRKLENETQISVAFMVESILKCKWSVKILQLCIEGYRRPSEFLRACPKLSAKVMNERLRKMVSFGILQRAVYGEKAPIHVEYRLTPFGHKFLRVIEEIRRLQNYVDQVMTKEIKKTQK